MQRFHHHPRITLIALACVRLTLLTGFAAPDPTRPEVPHETGAVVATGTRSDHYALGSLLSEVGPLREHFVDLTDDDNAARHREDARYAAMEEEKNSGKWIAALVSDGEADHWSILYRFASAMAMKRFFRERDAVVEMWFHTEDDKEGRRLTQQEIADWTRLDERAPTYLTVTFRDQKTGIVRHGRMEFGFGGAAESLSAALTFRRQRHLQQEMRRVLGARDASGNFSAVAQWHALAGAKKSGSVPIRNMPPRPTDDRDYYQAFECTTTLDGMTASVLRVFKASEIKPRLIGGEASIEIRPEGSTPPLAAVVFAPPGSPGEPPIDPDHQPHAQGNEVRIRNPNLDDRRLWTRLEFGEPALVRRQGLAHFGLVNAHMESDRKDLALKKAKLDRIAEPVFAGLNIGGGIGGAGAPLGESARLGYNLLIGRKYLPDVPTTDELRQLYALHLAKSDHPKLRGKEAQDLNRFDHRRLRIDAKKISPQRVEDALRTIDGDDLAAMMQLSRRQNNDQKYRLFADILTDLAKVTGKTKSGIVRDIFDNKKLAPNGELGLSTLLLLAFDKELTPLSNHRLEDLAKGEGPTRAWAQFFNLSLDLRAIANTAYLLRKKDELDREIHKPFAHAPRLSDLAAYEIRVFGYPMLLRYKRGLLEDDIEAYRNDFAYGVLGTRVIARFPTQNDFYRELRAGTMAPIGLVRIPKKRALLPSRRREVESNLPVFGYRIPTGEHAGQTAIIIYGLEAHRDYSRTLEREVERFAQFERLLESGGVIEQLVSAEDADSMPRSAFEPQILVGERATTQHFAKLLGDLLEFDRHVKFARWNVRRTPEEEQAAKQLIGTLRSRGIVASPTNSPLVYVDDNFGSFTFQRPGPTGPQLVKVVNFSSNGTIERDIRRKAAAAKAEAEARRKAREKPEPSPLPEAAPQSRDAS